MRNNSKLSKLLLSAVAMIAVIVMAITLKINENKKDIELETTSFSVEVTESTTYEENNTSYINQETSDYITRETYEIAPTDSSDWEIHGAINHEPDTGETIAD